ncbi:MAG TPA: Zn-ribbon domain-containing OB-fold protein [Chloroflexi bacterium]|nr:MAG: nucleotide-binding protein [Anaerolineaceae bacterium 4572_5.2]HEY84562.1 Zn-ribbon domain-containing OB-fold protein [Chloroflexota bacterium]
MSKKIPARREETLGGYILHAAPFPREVNEETLAMLKQLTPIQIEQPYSITYLHSYGQDSPFFAGLSNKVQLGNRDPETGYTYATPRGHDMYNGNETDWVQMPAEGTLHAFTVCHFGSEEFLPETPFVLALVEFEGADTLFLTRLTGIDPDEPSLDWIGMKVKARYLRNSKFKPTDVYFNPA